jgi:hypothetical protein
MHLWHVGTYSGVCYGQELESKMLFQPKPRLIARVNYKCGIKDSTHTGRVAGDKTSSFKARLQQYGFLLNLSNH